MKRFLTTGFLGAILGIVMVGAPADASLISRGFFDEKIANYATLDLLDSKANQSDLTDLSNKIGDAWPYGRDITSGLWLLTHELYAPEINLASTSDLVRYLFGDATGNYLNGAPGLINTLAESVYSGYDVRTGTFPDEGFKGLLQLTDGWTDSKKKTYLGVKGLNDKIGTLPDGLTVQGMYEGWTDKTTNTNYLGITGLNNAIGTLPTGEGYLPTKTLTFFLPGFNFTFPRTLGEFMYSMYVPYGAEGEPAPYPSLGNLTDVIYFGNLGSELLPSTYHFKGLRQLTDEIGTLPSGNFPEIPGAKLFYTYPTSLAELINAIYGNSETGARGLLDFIIAGFTFDTDGDGQFDSDVGLLQNFMLARDASLRAEANATKIGTLPTEYATVGAALTAMKSDIDAKSLPSTSADGQYVLTAKKVGETISYTWVKMDLTNEEQSQ